MTYFEDEDYDYRPPLAFRLEQVFKKDSNYDDYEDFEYRDVTDKVEIMQYTGLHDKNGKEIYEGDIVKAGYDKAIVKYSDDCSGYILKPIGEYYFDSPMVAHNMSLDLEIIGNVYEDKSLLED